MAAGLLSGLGRPSTEYDAVLAEKIGALSIRERRLRQGGKAKEAQDVTRLLLRALALLRGRGVNMPVGDPVAAMNDYLATFVEGDAEEDADAEAEEHADA